MSFLRGCLIDLSDISTSSIIWPLRDMSNVERMKESNQNRALFTTASFNKNAGIDSTRQKMSRITRVSRDLMIQKTKFSGC